MGKIIKHPAIKKRPGGARKIDPEIREWRKMKCAYPGCTADADRQLGNNGQTLCESHYQRLRNPRQNAATLPTEGANGG